MQYTSFILLAWLFLSAGSASAFCQNKTPGPQEGKLRVQKFVRDMKIAKSRGDIDTINTVFQREYEGFLKQCTEEERIQICGFSCTLEIGSYYYFNASDVPYYFQSNRNLESRASTLFKFAEDGITFVKGARKLLDQQAKGDFLDYIAKGTQYNLLLAKLHMTAGDIWYQSVSDSRLQRLRFMVKEKADINAQPVDSEISNALTKYDEANEAIQSASMELPLEQAELSPLAVELVALQHEIKIRRESASKGFLFLNIDPEEFTAIPFIELKSRLDEVTAKLEDAEGKIENLRTNWATAKGNRSAEQLNEELQLKDMSATESSYKIAKLEEMAQSMATEFDSKFQGIAKEKANFEYEKEKFGLEFQLKQRLVELTNQQDLLRRQNEIDVMDLKQADQERRLGDIRWLMDWQVAMTNLQIQVNQFDAEIMRHEADRKIQVYRAQQNKNRVAINTQQIESAKESKLISQNNETALIAQRDAINVEQEKSLEAQLCNLHIRMAFLGMSQKIPPYTFKYGCAIPVATSTQQEYLTNMCDKDRGLRRQMSDLGVKTVKDALCVLGTKRLGGLAEDPAVASELSKCPADRISQEDFVDDIFKKEMQLAEAEIKATEDQRKRTAGMIATLSLQFTTNLALRTGLEIETAIAGAMYELSSISPEITTCLCGVGSGVATTTSPRETLRAALESAQSRYNTFMSWADFVAKNTRAMQELESALNNYKNALTSAEYAKEIKYAHGMKALAEIAGQELALKNDLQSRLKDKALTIADCNQQAASLEETKATSLVEHARLVAEITALDHQNKNLNLSIANEKSQRLKEDYSIQGWRLENSNLDIEDKTVAIEIDTLDKLIGQAKKSKDEIEKTKTRVTGLQNEATAVKDAIDALAAMREKSVIKLADTEFDKISDIISSERAINEKLQKFATNLHGLDQIDLNLRNELTAFSQSINTQVATERQKILNTIYMQKSQIDKGQRENSFMATQEEMAEFEKGVPAFISEKKTLLAEANRLLVLIRNQVSAMVSLQGDEGLSLSGSEPLLYVKNHTDVEKLKTMITGEMWKGEQAIITQTTPIEIPSNSGLARQLATEQKASFEISPYARDQMPELGYFSLWDADWDADANGLSQHQVLIDVNMVMHTDCLNAHPKRFVITHKGQGLVFKELSEDNPTMRPSLVITESRSLSPTYEMRYEGSTVNAVYDFWGKHFQLNNFMKLGQAPNLGGSSSLPPLLGLPLIGQYEIALPNPGRSCSLDDVSYTLYFTYAMTQRKQSF